MFIYWTLLGKTDERKHLVLFQAGVNLLNATTMSH